MKSQYIPYYQDGNKISFPSEVEPKQKKVLISKIKKQDKEIDKEFNKFKKMCPEFKEIFKRFE